MGAGVGVYGQVGPRPHAEAETVGVGVCSAAERWAGCVPAPAWRFAGPKVRQEWDAGTTELGDVERRPCTPGNLDETACCWAT